MDNYSAELTAKIKAAAAAGGGEVFILAGKYLIGPGSVEVTAANVHLRGEGKGRPCSALTRCRLRADR
jgi:hypothetical protein